MPPQRMCVKVSSCAPSAKRQKVVFDLTDRELQKATQAAEEILAKRKGAHSEAAVSKEVGEIARRRKLFESLNCVYVGRPACDGGAYRVPELKCGSLFANPFPVKNSGLENSLAAFSAYLKLRCETNDVDTLALCLPAEIKEYLSSRHTSKPKIQFDYLRLVETKSGPALLGSQFALALSSLRNKNLGCFCDFGSPCHADELLRLANLETKHAEHLEAKQADS